MIQLEQLEFFYENQASEDLRLQADSPQRLEFLTASRYLEQYLPDGATILDNCAGSGIYAFHLAEKGYRVTAGDLVPYNVELMQSRQEKQPILDKIYLGDARNLSQFEEESFDAVLCMGALYHLDDSEERSQTVSEGLRVLREGGILACTYMNRYAVILNNLTPDLSNLDEILAFLGNGREGVFYTSTPEESVQMFSEQNADIICHVTLDGMSTFLRHTTGLINEDSFEQWSRYHNAVCEIPSLLGYGYHNLIIVRKHVS